jgi:hypothetical protein
MGEKVNLVVVFQGAGGPCCSAPVMMWALMYGLFEGRRNFVIDHSGEMNSGELKEESLR